MTDLHDDGPGSAMLPTKGGIGITVPAVVFDLDGVLCDSSQQIADAVAADGGRAGNESRVDWIEWNKQPFPCNPEWVTLAQIFANADVAVIILTARQEPSTDVTEKWLLDNDVPFDELLMRPMDHDYETWKADAIRALRDSPYDVQIAFDDSLRHATAMREAGVPVVLVRNESTLAT